MDDKLVLTKAKPKEANTAWKPVMVKGETFEKLDALSNELEKNKGEIATQMIEFALAHLEIREGD